MVSMPVPKDIRNFQPKFIGPFSKRQFMSLVPAGIFTAFMIMVVGKIMPSELLYLIIAIVDIPIVACGFIDIQGVPLNVFLKESLLTKATFPTNRFYKTDNIYETYSKQNRITYAYFDGDVTEYTGKQLLKKQKEYKKRLEDYYKLNPKMRPLDTK